MNRRASSTGLRLALRLALWLLLALPALAMIRGYASREALAMDLLHPTGETALRLMIVAMFLSPLIYLVLWIYGLVVDLNSSANFVPLNTPDNWLHLVLGIVLGGTLGNFTDRLRQGYVTDFVSVGVGNVRFPTFNVADSSIVVGIGILVVVLMLLDRAQETVTA